MNVGVKREELGVLSCCVARRPEMGVSKRRRDKGLAGRFSVSRSTSLRDRFLPEAERVEGRRVGVDGEELTMIWSDELRASRLEGVLGMSRAGMMVKKIARMVSRDRRPESVDERDGRVWQRAVQGI